MVVADDELDAAHAAVHEVVQEIAPVDLGLGQRGRHAQQAPPAVRADADGRQDGRVADDAAVADLLVPGIEDQVCHRVEPARAPGPQFVVQQGGGAADLR